jgi:hypothetical protein
VRSGVSSEGRVAGRLKQQAAQQAVPASAHDARALIDRTRQQPRPATPETPRVAPADSISMFSLQRRAVPAIAFQSIQDPAT